jgi:hypothetical protein
MKNKFLIIFFTILVTAMVISSNYEENKNQIVSYKCDINIINKQFVSGELKLQDEKGCQFLLPANKKSIITICNKDNLAMEFESHDLSLEKIIKSNMAGKVNIPALEKNKTYKFFEEFYGYECEFLAI